MLVIAKLIRLLRRYYTVLAFFVVLKILLDGYLWLIPVSKISCLEVIKETAFVFVILSIVIGTPVFIFLKGASGNKVLSLISSLLFGPIFLLWSAAIIDNQDNPYFGYSLILAVTILVLYIAEQ
jgi:hypothetical protein